MDYGDPLDYGVTINVSIYTENSKQLSVDKSGYLIRTLNPQINGLLNTQTTH